jgi:hypothetical protein
VAATRVVRGATLYRYGRIAWIWRALILAALVGGSICVYAGVTLEAPVLLPVAAPVILPALFFGFVVATRVEGLADGSLRVHTLLFARRRVDRARLGTTRVHFFAQATVTRVYAPRAWVGVRRGLPIYLDLFAEIPDRRAFANTFRIDRGVLPRRSPVSKRR